MLSANAGYGHERAVEESAMADRPYQFAVNLFGGAATIKAGPPSMRGRRSGRRKLSPEAGR
jgi:NAD(P)-dependent dehydrogenase (short-subunit alcohol dehydrogenase family)